MIGMRRLAAAALVLVAAIVPAFADDYPSKPIEVVVPAAAGGGSDVLVRALQPYMEKELNGTIVVLNVPGSGSVGGSRKVVEAAPDGYTVLANHVTLLTAMALGKADFKYDAYALAATAVQIPLVVVVPADSDIKDLKDLLTRAKDTANPLIAGVNLGAVNHFAMLMLQALEPGASFRFVQTGGGAETSAALLGHHIAAGVLASSEAKPLVASGDIRILATLGNDRVSYFPDVPTAQEEGYDINLGIEYYWFMPAGTPQDRLDKFADALHTALQNPDVLKVLDQQGMIPTFETGKDSWARLESLYKTLEAAAAKIEQ